MRLPLIVDDPGGATRDVVVDFDPEHRVADLATAVTRFLTGTADPAATLAIDRFGPLDADLTVRELGLRAGDVLRLGGSGGGTPRGRATLTVVGGPAAGLRHPLPEGTWRVGRSSDNDVAIPDDDALSRRHLAVTIAGDSVTVADLGSSNGTFVDGARIAAPTAVTAESVVEAGNSLLTVTVGRTAATAAVRAERADFNRQPRTHRPFTPPEVDLPTPPEQPAKARFPLAASVVPLVMGVVMAVALGQMTFLIFSAMGPVMAVWSLVDDRRSGRKKFRTEAKAFQETLEERAAEIEVLHRSGVDAQTAAAPSPTELLVRAETLAPDLWERRPEHTDFLSLRLGTADLPSVLRVRVPEDGSADLRAEERALAQRFAVDPGVPVTVSLLTQPVVGLVGDARRRAALARSLVVQAATLHSPAELVIAVIAPGPAADDWDWVKWLPHVRSLEDTGALAVALDRGSATEMIGQIRDLAQSRLPRSGLAEAAAPSLPHLLLVIAEDAGADPALLAEALAVGRSTGIHAVALADTADRLPGATAAIVDLGGSAGAGRLTITGSGTSIDGIVTDEVTGDVAREVATALAPVRDVTARSVAGGLPTQVSLLEQVGLVDVDADQILERWNVADRRTLSATIGVTETGTLSIDFRDDGPHALAGGTSGAGKSEFLQTMVAALALAHPPSAVTFVLVDYKGGAAFKDCEHLPHTVGFVTDLDDHLAVRALVSLNAELKRREEILRHADARDLMQMITRDPRTAPPSLVIVVDEFATLAKEVPDFVAGIVDVAQRGRSLGVHLVLATQRPQGSINDNIRANTNLRISLRMTDENESRDVIDVPDAALIPRGLPGRGLIRTGHGEIRRFQASYVGGHTQRSVKVGHVRLAPFLLGTPAQFDAVPTTDGHTEVRVTDLKRLAGAISDAHARSAAPAPTPPWLPALPGLLTIDDLARTSRPATSVIGAGDIVVPLGLLDEPERQRQDAWSFDLERDGHLIAYGTSGTGKTTLLRTLVATAATLESPDRLHVYGLDFASRGLAALEPLPHCGGVVNGNDTERVERVFTMLEAWIEERKNLLGATGTASIAEFRRARPDAESPPTVLVVLDGYPAFFQSFEPIDNGALVDSLNRCVAEGRPLGIHFAITADRRGGVPAALVSSIPTRVVFRMADRDDYAALDLMQVARDVALPPGRAFVDAGAEVQMAVVGRDASGAGQADALAALAVATPAPAPGGGPAPVRLVPNDLPLAELPGPGPHGWEVPIGIHAGTLAPLRIDLEDPPNFVVAGADRSGRSTTLVTIASGLAAAQPGARMAVLAPRRSPLLDAGLPAEVHRGVQECEEAAVALAAEVARRSESDPPLIVVIDDGDELTELKASDALEALLRRGRDVGVHVVAAVQTYVLHRTYGGWLAEIRKAKHGVILSPDVEIDGEIFAVRFPRKAFRAFPPGRGFLVRRGDLALVQIAR